MATIDRDKLLSKEKLEKTFAMFDKDKSGTLDMGEIKQMFGGVDMADKVWKEILKEVDDNGDGKVSFEEFIKMMKSF
jgi:calcium-dependent protein kinase